MSYMSEPPSIFLDSNVWYYALSTENNEKALKARELVKSLGNSIYFSSQVVNEVCVNLKRRVPIDEKQIRVLIESFYLNYNPVEINRAVLHFASELRERHKFSFWDALITASALLGGAEILYSEDMQDGFVLDNKLKIINPFISN